MKVSVIVPVYNVEEYLAPCLDSLVKQTLQDIEIIVVNDGSPDNSQEIIDRYVKKYPNLVKAMIKENGGQASARNMALEIAKGEYVNFVDSDDWVKIDMYENMYKKAKEEDADIVVCNTTDYYKDYAVYHKPAEFTNKLKQTPSPCNKLFKRSFIGDLRFPEGKMWYEDFTFVTELLMMTDKIARCENDYYQCNCREESTMSNNNSPKNLDILKALDLIIKFAKDNNLYDRYKEDIDFMIIDHILITTINRVAKQTHPEKERVIEGLREYVKNQLPNVKKLKVFKEMPLNRRIVAALNLQGLHNVSKAILSIKAKI
ncbi:glycosyltransferase family 2 protein [Clostridium culturomicium]|uniref:glycosyltransferase family 2 protein n=1 Tax=Clostridium culturomicium TaxID=1499683 RepID=UPI00069409DE|nr:glycosyltransferase [Clostridium culturomicium]